MRRLRLFSVALLLVLLADASAAEHPALAQTRGDGSLYSRYGVGQLWDVSSSQSQAMGGTGLALRSLNYTGFSNPALWSDQLLARLRIGARYQGVEIQDASGQNSRLTAGTLDAVQFSFPLLSERLGLAIGFQPYSRVNYRVQNAPQPIPGDTTSFRFRFEGEGGLQQISGGLGYRFGDALSVGARVDVIFGIIEELQRTEFDSPLYQPTTFSRNTRLAGVTGTAGALLTLADVLSTDDALSVGATLTLPTTLTGKRVRTLGESLDRDTLSTEQSGSTRLPLGAGLGLSYKPDDRWTLAASGRYEPWSNFESDFDIAGAGTFRDRLRGALGVEFLPAGDDLTEPFLARIAYRLGGYYEQSQVRAATVLGPEAPDRGINTWAATGGLSFPTPLYGTRLDLNFEVGRRGTTSSGLLRDVFYGVSVGVNIGERWFQRRKLR